LFTCSLGPLLMGARPRSWLDVLAVMALMASAACSTTRFAVRGTPGRLGYDTTVNAGCRNNPARCANDARSDVLLRHQGRFRKAFPDADECRQMTVDAWGREVTWSIRLGVEMHEDARKCAERVLSSLWSGGFSLEQLYRFDRRTGRKKLVSAEEEKLLVDTGNGGELLGSLRPDVVLHSGDPLRPQAVYDFKFPCVNIDRIPPWSDYPSGHPYEDSTQGDMYEEAFGGNVARIAPRWGVIR
jgi:hypothetical protein